MADKSPKKVYNSLLNASVTGATLEEFTQNAILCPVSEAPLPLCQPSPNDGASAKRSAELQPSSPETFTSQNRNHPPLNQYIAPPFSQQPLQPQANPQYQQSFFTPQSSSFQQQTFSQPPNSNQFAANQQFTSAVNLFPSNPQPNSDQYTYPPLLPSTPPSNSSSSSLTLSVISSFSNILNFGGQSKPVEPVVGPGVDSVPLFSTNQQSANFQIGDYNDPNPLEQTAPLSVAPPVVGSTLPPSVTPPVLGSTLPPSVAPSRPPLGVPTPPRTLTPKLAPLGVQTLPPSTLPTPLGAPVISSGISTFPTSESPILPSGISPVTTAVFSEVSSVLPSSQGQVPLSSSVSALGGGKVSSPFASVSSTVPTVPPPFSAVPLLQPSGVSILQPPGVSILQPSGISPVQPSGEPTLQPPGIPLVPPSVSPPVNLPPPPTQAAGGFNSYRRQRQKRLAYAPIPGFSTGPQQAVPLQPPVIPAYDQNITEPLPPFVPEPVPTPLASNSNSVGAYPLKGHFDPKPSNFLIPSTDLSEIQSLDCASSAFLTPVMSKKPDVSSSTDPATLNSSTTSYSLRSVTPVGAIDNPPKMSNSPYRPVYHHWFHRREIEGRVIWQPFSMVDSLALEAAFVSTDISPEHMVATDGGRYDVNILRRQRSAVYWKSTPTEVRRCSWFFKGNNDGRFTPYEENIATKLEEEYKAAYEVNQWHRKVELPNGEMVIFQAPDVLVLLPQSSSPDVWNNASQTAVRPRIVKRGMDEFDIDEGEPSKIDHLLFLVHGIGSVCDLKFRSVEEVVDDFRSISLQLVQSHYKSSCDKGLVNRIEVLPVSWHNQLHSEDTGIDKKLKSITLESIPRLRDFTNDTLLDILFYTSPIYSQTIISTVGNEMNRLYDLFRQRNPGFKGAVSVGGHSLGSLILFDILCHQHAPDKDDETANGESDEDVVPPIKHLEKPAPLRRRMSRRISYMMGKVGTGQVQITYPQLSFHPITFFALGSPIGMFVTVRGLESLGEHFALPTCQGFFNIFHPYDPVAYRIESLINADLANVRPVLIPHHKGRKRMHLELKETMARVGADLKQRVMDSMKSTWNSVYQLAMFHRQDNRSLEAEVNKALEEQLAEEERERVRLDSTSEEDTETDLPVGILNDGRRVDYVLQEAPFEFFNEYIFALTSHVCYWESEDTMLLILKEIYNSMGVNTDSQVPQQTMTIERSSPSPVPGEPRSMQMANPLRPVVYNANLAPPQTSGFVRKT